MNLTIPIISTILRNFFVINTRGYDILHYFYNVSLQSFLCTIIFIPIYIIVNLSLINK